MPFLKDFLINNLTKVILWKIIPGELSEKHINEYDKKLLKIRKRSDPKKISSFIQKLKENEFNADWAVCAFSKEEISCLKTAIKLGGKIRVGFENSFLMPDGSVAPDNETKVKAAKNLFD